MFRRAMTPAEDRLWGVLCGKALGCRARKQHVIRGWIVDFYVPSARLVIEVDGGVHDAQVEEDQLRTLALESEGLRVIRFRNEAVLDDLPWVIARIEDAMQNDERRPSSVQPPDSITQHNTTPPCVDADNATHHVCAS
jgi:leucyl-tRNA synthetase